MTATAFSRQSSQGANTLQKPENPAPSTPASGDRKNNDDDIRPVQDDLGSPPQPYVSSSTLFMRVSFLGVAFSLIFTGYNVAQSFVTTMYESSGFAALALIYATFAVTSLFAPLINNILESRVGSGNGEKFTMALSGLGYVAFILSLATGSEHAVFIGGFMKGVASGLLWISQGIWLTKIVTAFRIQEEAYGNDDAHNIIGIATGVFFTIFNLNGIFGNAIVIALINSGVSMNTTIYTMAALVMAGTLLILFITPAPKSGHKKDVSYEMLNIVSGGDALGSKETISTVEKTLHNSTIYGRLRSIGKLSRQRETVLLTPYLICQGLGMAYTYGNFPTFIHYVTYDGGKQLDNVGHEYALNIAYAFLAYGIGSMIGSYGWGKLYDYAHGKLYPLLISHVILIVATFLLLIFTVIAPIPYPRSLFPSMCIVGFNFGLIDFLNNAIINNSITQSYKETDVPVAFSWYRFCFCIGFSVASIMSMFLPGVHEFSTAQDDGKKFGWLTLIIVNIVFTVISVFFAFILENQTRRRLQSERRRSQFMAA
eukprot:Partr_v1_DN26197_c0_g1_i1_m10328 putative DUF895 domain membrane protein